ncbi:histidine-tRNA ligase [Batrachochytrium salamandrivorans]|nr:histidine-tRNA ligase [Batrachochytrium salamandrivorans]
MEITRTAKFSVLSLDEQFVVQAKKEESKKQKVKGKQMDDQKYIPRAPTGMVDIAPEHMPLRRHVFDLIRSIYKRHGALEIETPVCELKETLTGKYGEDSKLVYDLQDQGGELLSLRYDLTVPFARYLAVNEHIDKMRRFHIARVYRRDTARVNKGRFREFYQCDFDCAGVYADMVPDAECIKVCTEVLDQLGFEKHGLKYEVKVSHRDLLDGVFALCQVPEDNFRQICSAVDKLDKEPWEVILDEMVNIKHLPMDKALMLGRFVANQQEARDLEHIERLCAESTNESAKARCNQGIASLRKFFDYCALMKVPMANIQFDMTMARGLDYYTGVIFEVVLRGEGGDDVGSIAGGGRYDNLVGMFSNKQIPCVGISLGVERLITVLQRLQEGEQPKSETLVLVGGMDDSKFDSLPPRMALCADMWQAGVNAEFPQDKKKQKIKDLFELAERRRIPVLVYFGGSEWKKDMVKIRQFFHDKRDADGHVERVEFDCSKAEMVTKVKTLLGEMGLL